jgi:hypothetical protein
LPEITTEEGAEPTTEGGSSTFAPMIENEEEEEGDEDDNINVVCTSTPDGQAVFIPYPYDCSLYYMCEGFTPTLMSCPLGLEFDSALNVCNWPFAAGCVATPRPTEPAPEVTTEELPEATTEDLPEVSTEDGPEPTTEGFTEETSMPVIYLEDDGDHIEDNLTVVCPPSQDGLPVFIPFPYDCTKYFVCVFNDAVLMECAQGTEWDTQRNICNWPALANCQATPR